MRGDGLMLRRAGRLLAALAMASALAAPGPAAADRQDILEAVEARFGAEVLRIRRGTVAGEAVWRVTMMRHGGDENAAFKVDTIAVDAKTGEPLQGRRLGGAGANNLSSARTQMTEKQPEVLRSRPWR